MKTYKSSSTQRPPEWDRNSSPTRVYHNFNVEEVPATEDTPVMYRYDVEEYTPEEYMTVQDKRIEEQGKQIALLTECVLEMSADVYA